jgi:phosphoserine aminotransferase
MREDQYHNFNAGPAALPPKVISAVQIALTGIEGGPGILELSHRSSAFDRVINQAREQITQLYKLPESHEVLFLQGGASLQFAMLAMNLGVRGGFITTGEWSRRALAESRTLATAGSEVPVELWSSEERGFRDVPQASISLSSDDVDLNYVHLTSNNTIFGTQYASLPTLDAPEEHSVQGSDIPLIIDASSDIFSRPLDWSRIGLLYAGAQKNAGPSGVTLVIGRRDWLRADPVFNHCPKILRYRTHAEKNSLYHTPNTLGIFTVGEVAKWVAEHGGVEAMRSRSQTRANKLYQVIDAYPDVFTGHASVNARSLMNITFRGANDEIEQTLLNRAQAANMIGLKGHRSVGGLRASLYNAVSDESVSRLVSLVDEVGRQYTSSHS